MTSLRREALTRLLRNKRKSAMNGCKSLRKYPLSDLWEFVENDPKQIRDLMKDRYSNY